MFIEKTHTVDGITFITDALDMHLTKEKAKVAIRKMNAIEKQYLRDYIAEGNTVALMSIVEAGGLGGSFSVSSENTGVLALTVFPVIGILKGLVAHELTHYDQWKRGDVSFNHTLADGTPGVIWKGQEYRLINERCMAYLDQPWEIEAHQNEYRFMAKHGGSWLTEKALMRRVRWMTKAEETVIAGIRKCRARKTPQMA